MGSEVAQLQKKNFSENSLVLMLYIWNSGRIMKPARQIIFLIIFMPENLIFCHFCPNVPKKREDLNGRHNFFCICRLARLKIYVRGLLLYFQQKKNFLKLANFSRTCTLTQNRKPWKKNIFFHGFRFWGVYRSYWSWANFKKKLFFESIIVTL